MITSSTNFQYIIDPDYDYWCDGCYGCETGNDYCRGARHHDFRLANPSPGELASIAGLLIENAGLTPDLRRLYALERQLSQDTILQNLLGDAANWEFNTSGGYYGDEIDSICLTDQQALNGLNTLAANVSRKTNRAVLDSLVAEYGHVLSGIRTFEAHCVPVARLVATNAKPLEARVRRYADNYYTWVAAPGNKRGSARKVALDGKFAKAGRMPVAIVRPAVNGRYKIIDGNHRAAAVLRRDKNAEVIVLVARA